jgi:hypothetical protein
MHAQAIDPHANMLYKQTQRFTAQSICSATYVHCKVKRCPHLTYFYGELLPLEFEGKIHRLWMVCGESVHTGELVDMKQSCIITSVEVHVVIQDG